jgi:protein TonB
MRTPIGNGIGTWNLKTFLSMSIGLHVLFVSGLTFLFPDFRIDQLPPLNIEISLLPIMAQERSKSLPLPSRYVKAPTKKEEKKLESSLPFHPEMKITPVSVPTLGEVKLEKRDKEEEEEGKVGKEPVIQTMAISLNPEAMLTRSTEPTPVLEVGVEEEHPDSTLPTPSPPGEARKEGTYPSFSGVEMAFIQPRYAENPKPLYPEEARRKGYQGEVVLKVEVLPNGLAGQVDVKKSSGHEILDRSALAAVKQWKFIPARKGESPVPFWVNIPIKFQLQ